MSSQTQFIRYAKLVVAQGSSGLDLSNLHFTFRTTANDVETPNTATIRVYNLNQATEKQVINEFDSVVLDVGYGSNHGIIFKGTIKQFHRGRERNVDSYLDLLAADGDSAYNFSFINQTFAAGSTPVQQLEAYANSMGLPLDPNAPQQLTGGVILSPRGKSAFGLTRNYMRDLAKSNGCRWSIQNGVVTLISLTGYLPGQAVKINSSTGMIGIPEATDDGIKVKILINPSLAIGGAVQISEKDITQTIVKEQFFPNYQSGPTLVADVTRDGIYRILVIEHEGDTRGTAWYTNMTCLSLDPSASVVNSVVGGAFGG